MKTNSTDGSEIRPDQRTVIGRRALPHDPPLSIDPAKEIFFITICCKRRKVNQLCREEVASVLFEAVRFYQKKHVWFVHLMLLMPDHAHFLVRFAMDARLRNVIASWKRFTTARGEIQWQRDFFDHCLRGNEGWRRKADYILANPIRAGLAVKTENWPYVLINQW